ncbi:CDP-alcohol phosphatidyltransferase family protein [Aestuariivirga litoralis]|nr:CDP-alcohol phosphatidyltransferase family protein [Aestuariivirga litoralis]
MKAVSLASIISDYRAHKMAEELTSDWGSVVFYRYPAFVLTWAVAPLGVTPNQLTMAGALLVPLIALAAWLLPVGWAMAVITVLALAFNVLDCADGSLARATGRSSLLGRYLDFAVDVLYRNTAYAAYGLIADRIWPGAAIPWLTVGLCCGLLVTYARLNRVYAEKLFPPRQAASGPVRRSAFDRVFSILSGIDTLLPLVALIAWAAGLLWVAMIWFLFYTLGDALVELAGNLQRAREIDDTTPRA